MKSLIKKLFGTNTTRPTKCQRSSHLDVEALECRLTPATIGITKYAALDFDGEYINSTHMAQGGWSGYGSKFLSSFQSLFNNSRSWLDLNSDGLVNGTDAQIAIDHVMDKVTTDFAPYRLNVFEMDQDDSQSYLTDGAIGDVSVIIAGEDSTDVLGSSNAWGVAPWADVGNNDDEIVFVFAGGSVDSSVFGNDSLRPYRWLNQVARTVSHEMGHAFGLEHEVADYGALTDALSHSMMGTTNRDWNRDFVFQDRSFQLDDGTYQNAHRELLKENILGRSNKTFVGVINPGELTVMGNSSDNNIQVYKYNDNYWQVVVDGDTTYVNLNSYNVFSQNPFDLKVNKLNVEAEEGDDYVYISIYFTNSTSIYAGDGDDTVYGGYGNDLIVGGEGNDYLQGRDGKDYLFGSNGNDSLYGGDGNDYLYGMNGDDAHYGGNGNDYSSGGAGDDYISGGSGYDIAYGGDDFDILLNDNEYRNWA